MCSSRASTFVAAFSKAREHEKMRLRRNDVNKSWIIQASLKLDYVCGSEYVMPRLCSLSQALFASLGLLPISLDVLEFELVERHSL